MVIAADRQPGAFLSNRKLFRQQRPLNVGMMARTGGLAVVATLPEADLAFVNAQSGSKAPLGQASQDAGGAELAACDKVLAVCGHGNLHSFSDASHAAAKVAVEKRIKCRPDGLAVMFAALA